LKAGNFITGLLKKTELGFYKELKHYLSAEIIIKSVGLLTLPILTKLLSPDEFGVLKIYESLVLIFIIIASLGLPSAIKRKYYDYSPDFNSYSGSSINLIIAFNFFLFPIIFLFKKPVSEYLNFDEKIIIIAWISSFLMIFYRIYTDYLQAAKRSKEFTVLKVSQGLSLVFISLLWIYLLTDNRFYGKIYAELLINAIFLLILIPKIRSIYSFSFDLKKLADALKFSLPMIPALLSALVLSYFDQIIINDLKGSYQTGLYSVAYQIGMIVYMIQLSSAAAYQPYFFEAVSKNNIYEFQNLIKKYTKFIVFISISLVVFSQEIGKLFTDSKYYEGLVLIPVIVFSYILYYFYTLYANYYVYYKKTGIASLIIIFLAILNIVLNYIFIPKFGYFAAAYTTLFAYFLQFLLLWILVYKFVKNKDLILKIGIFYTDIFLFVISLILFFVLYFTDFNIVIELILKLSFVILSAYILFKNILFTNKNI
jgi:O-antigen/teichoic acid export membrane protein